MNVNVRSCGLNVRERSRKEDVMVLDSTWILITYG